MIRARKFLNDPHPVTYIVAVSEAAEAMQQIKTKAAERYAAFDDLGRVSDRLLATLHLSPGEFVRLDKVRP